MHSVTQAIDCMLNIITTHTLLRSINIPTLLSLQLYILFIEDAFLGKNISGFIKFLSLQLKMYLIIKTFQVFENQS